MEAVLPLLLFVCPLALVGLFGWVNRKLGWPTTPTQPDGRGPQPMLPHRATGAHYLGADFSGGFGGGNCGGGAGGGGGGSC